MTALTIGMATYKDFEGVYFTLQALRLYQDLEDTELLVVDNYGCDDTRQFVERWAKGRYILATETVGTAAAKNVVFREARGNAVLCCDSHILFAPGAIARLKAYYREHPDCIDLLQGPLVYDNLRNVSTHWEPVWRDQMWGILGSDRRGHDPEGEPFEIQMQGMGVFSCRRSVWPGFNPAFLGFGGEEGYLHEKVRQAGGRCLCLPWLRWVHRFVRPAGAGYPLFIEDKLRNYLIGFTELGLDIAPALKHFAEYLPPETIEAVREEALRTGFSGPPGPASTDHADDMISFSENRAIARNPRQESRSHDTNSATPAKPASRVRNRDQDLPLPLVSCICPTYNRLPFHGHLIEEAIESFLRQTYPNKELIVLNDCVGQELVCDAPGVRVVNVAERFPTLGEKRNAAHSLARGELFAPWDDDDISLPWRLSLLVDRLGNADYLNPDKCWRMDSNGLRYEPIRCVYPKSIFTRSAFEAVGGYQPISYGEDYWLESAILASGRHPDPPSRLLRRSQWYYIYRWQFSPLNLSSRGDTNRTYVDIGNIPVQPGRFVLQPHWRMDYVAETRLRKHAIAPGATVRH